MLDIWISRQALRGWRKLTLSVLRVWRACFNDKLELGLENNLQVFFAFPPFCTIFSLQTSLFSHCQSLFCYSYCSSSKVTSSSTVFRSNACISCPTLRGSCDSRDSCTVSEKQCGEAQVTAEEQVCLVLSFPEQVQEKWTGKSGRE